MAGFLEGELRPDAEASVREHVAECDECRTLLSQATRSSLRGNGDGAPRGPPPGQPVDDTTGFPWSALAGESKKNPLPRIEIDDPRIAPGTIFADKYRVDRLLGVGGMGYVVAALHLQLDQHVAIKLLRTEVAAVAGAMRRFTREARAAAKIQTEHVVRVFDVATLPSGEVYIVMEHLEGQDLRSYLQTHGARPVTQAVSLLLEACEALAHAHRAGIVHLDLKPANMFLARRPDGSSILKLLDFGISKVRSSAVWNEDEPHITQAKGPMGTPLYMSPEQIRSAGDVDERSDIWTLGVILHELLTNAPPFTADSVPALCAKIIEDAPPALGSLRADVPARLEEICLRCLQKRPRDRFADVGELALALEEFAASDAPARVARIRALFGRADATEKAQGHDRHVFAPSSHTGIRVASTPPPDTMYSFADPRTTSAAKRPRTWSVVMLAIVVGTPALLYVVTRQWSRATSDERTSQAGAAARSDTASLTAVSPVDATNDGAVVVDSAMSSADGAMEPKPSSISSEGPSPTTFSRPIMAKSPLADSGSAGDAGLIPTASPVDIPEFGPRK